MMYGAARRFLSGDVTGGWITLAGLSPPARSCQLAGFQAEVATKTSTDTSGHTCGSGGGGIDELAHPASPGLGGRRRRLTPLPSGGLFSAVC